MDPSLAHQDRQTQFLELSEQVSLSYVSLQLAYEKRGEEVKELKLAVIDYKQKSNYWETQFKQIKSREEDLQSELKD